MSHMTKGLHLHCTGPTEHPLLVARRARGGVRGEALFWSQQSHGAVGFEAGSGTVEVSCPCHPEPLRVDLAKVAERMRTHGRREGVSVADFLA